MEVTWNLLHKIFFPSAVKNDCSITGWEIRWSLTLSIMWEGFMCNPHYRTMSVLGITKEWRYKELTRRNIFKKASGNVGGTFQRWHEKSDLREVEKMKICLPWQCECLAEVLCPNILAFLYHTAVRTLLADHPGYQCNI